LEEDEMEEEERQITVERAYLTSLETIYDRPGR
jgi:hypothetical protein